MNYSLFIARRYLQTKKRSALVSRITSIAVGGVFVGVMTLVIVLSVINGFETGCAAHRRLQHPRARVRAQPGGLGAHGLGAHASEGSPTSWSPRRSCARGAGRYQWCRAATKLRGVMVKESTLRRRCACRR
jgi:hypothetical protein